LPEAQRSAFRSYPVSLVQRIHFIKRAQDLGFSLDEIAELIELDDGKNRRSIRSLAGARLQQIQAKIADLQRMEGALHHLIRLCAGTGQSEPCPNYCHLIRGFETSSR
jgi:MerR family mercuric resistance operon transcriptional regulator